MGVAMAHIATRGSMRHRDQENPAHDGMAAIVKKRTAVPVTRQGLGLVGNKNASSRVTRTVQDLKKPILKQKSTIAAGVAGSNVRRELKKTTVKVEPMETEPAKTVKLEAMEVGDTAENACKSETAHTNVFNLSTKPEIEDIDKEDLDNPQLCSEFVNDIYQYMLYLESTYPIHKHYMKETSLKPRMRTILVDWLFQVHHRFGLLQETMYLTVAILDRFLQVQPVARTKLQLAGVTAMLIASKYEEMYAPEVNDFVYITDQAFTRSQILQMEILMLKTLDFNLGKPLHLHFLRRNSKAGQVDANQHTLAKYLMELSMLDYEMCHVPPSKIAAAALCLSIKLLDDSEWTATLEHYSRYSYEALFPIICHLSKNLKLASTSTYLAAVRTKYASNKAFKISHSEEVQSPAVTELAEKAADINL